MNYLKCVASVLLSVTTFPLIGQAPEHTMRSLESAQERKKVGVEHKSEGDVKFAQHCSRCHNAPESLSPRISGTVVRHMRVRASLSKQDEEDILRFLNPK